MLVPIKIYLQYYNFISNINLMFILSAPSLFPNSNKAWVNSFGDSWSAFSRLINISFLFWKYDKLGIINNDLVPLHVLERNEIRVLQNRSCFLWLVNVSKFDRNNNWKLNLFIFQAGEFHLGDSFKQMWIWFIISCFFSFAVFSSGFEEFIVLS